MSNLWWVLWFVIAIVTMESCAMTCLKRSKDGWHWFMGGVLFYVGVATLLAESLKLEGLAVVNALWSGISVMATTSIGVLYFKEMLHLHDYVAIAMIGAGVVILKVTP